MNEASLAYIVRVGLETPNQTSSLGILEALRGPASPPH